MKNKIKQLSKLGILLILILVGITACEKESLQTTNSSETLSNPYQSKDFYIKEATFKEYYQEKKFSELIKNYDFLERRLFRQSSNDYVDDIYNFTIDSSSVREIYNNGTTSYTMAIYRSEYTPDYFENLVIKSDSSGYSTAFIIKYIHNGNIENFLNHDSYYFEGEREIYNVSLEQIYSRQVCMPVYETWCSWSSPHVAGPQCFVENDLNDGDRLYIVVSEECYDDGGFNSGGGGGNGGSNDGSSGEPTYTSPMYPDGSSAAPDFLINALGGSSELTSRQISWINNVDDHLDEIDLFLPFLVENGYTEESQDFVKDLIDAIGSDQDLDALTVALEAFNQDMLENAFDYNFLNSVNDHFDIYITPELTDPIYIHIATKIAVLKALNPEWSDMKCFWEAIKDGVHIALDVFGMVPVVGEVADLVNGALYAIEGDGINATISLAAAIPFVGNGATITKYGLKVVNAVSDINSKVKLVWKVTANGVEFGSRGQLRKVLGLLPGNPLQAHHLIPWASRNHDVIQKAAKSGNAFHMNEALNGIPVASWRNQPNHNTYNDLIEDALDDFIEDFPNATPGQCYDFVSNLINNIRDWVVNNPNSHLNDLVLP